MTDGMDHRVSVVMITYNRREETLSTLGRLRSLPERPRVVVVDNGSGDGTAAAVRAQFPEMELIEAGRNLGASGRNLGIDRVDTPYVAFCDDDTWWDPGHLARAADLFDASPRLALITARVLVGPEDVEDPTCELLANSPLPRVPGMPGPPLLGFLAGASMVRRAAFLEAGGFPSHLTIGGEEEWLAVEFAARGDWLCYVPELTVHHHPSEQRDPHARRRQQLRNALWFLWLRRPLAVALRRTLTLVGSMPRDRAARQGFAAALAGLPRLLPHRRVVPAEVEQGLRLLERGRPLAGD